MALDFAVSADHQWETDLVELLGLDVAADDAKSRAVGGQESSQPYFLLLAGLALAGAIPASILLERQSASELILSSSSTVRRSVAASVPVGLPTGSSRLSSVFTGEADKTATFAGRPRLSLPADENPRATLRAGLKPHTEPQPLVRSANATRRAEPLEPYAHASEQVRLPTANLAVAAGGKRVGADPSNAIPSVVAPSTVASPGTDVARNGLPSDRSLASKELPAAVGLGDGSSSAASRPLALSAAELQIGSQGASDSVWTLPGRAGRDQVKTKDQKRRTDAIDALRLLRRQ